MSVPRVRRYPRQPIVPHRHLTQADEQHWWWEHTAAPYAKAITMSTYAAQIFINSSTSSRPLPVSQGEPRP